MISRLPEVAYKRLLKIFNFIFSKYEYPLNWKEYNLVFIPKAGSNKLRPISLANTLFKLFERVVHFRLEWWIEHGGGLPVTQFGFRRGRSMADSVAKLTLDIKTAFARGRKLGAVFVDIRDAFDSVVPDCLIEELVRLKVPNKIIAFIDFIVRARRVRAFLGQAVVGETVVTKGVPQGSVLSPLLYSIYTSEICRGTEPEIDMLMYADDICFYTTDGNLRCLYDRLNRALDYLCERLRHLGLTLSCEKSKLCIFSRKGHVKIKNVIRKYGYKLSFAGTSVPLVDHARFLGVTFDKKLNWKMHTVETREKCRKRIKVLKAICGIE